jgi:hypothetical protein
MIRGIGRSYADLRLGESGGGRLRSRLEAAKAVQPPPARGNRVNRVFTFLLLR